MIARHYRRFIKEFASNPRVVGAVAPSSSRLAKGMVGAVDWDNTRALVEYGPGTGAITDEIMSQLPSETNFLAIEISSQFASMLRARFPAIQICEGSVEDVKTHCDAHRVDQVDAIVSGLPWAAFSDDDQSRFLDATMQVLRSGGQFITFAYLQGLLMPAGRRFRRRLHQYFSEVRVSAPVWINLPPAVYYYCRR